MGIEKSERKGQAKTGKKKDEIFSSLKPKHVTEKAPQAASIEDQPLAEKAARGRPQEHKEDWSKVTVVLLDKHIHWLDKLALDIRQNTKSAVSRAEIIRALIGAMEESKIDFKHAQSEKQLKEILLEAIK